MYAIARTPRRPNASPSYQHQQLPRLLAKIEIKKKEEAE